jgi:hypothetical protein
MSDPQFIDRQAVHCHQQSPQRFIAEWGIDPADVPLFYPERTER